MSAACRWWQVYAFASTIILAIHVESNAMVIAIMSVAFFGQGMVNLGWTLISRRRAQAAGGPGPGRSPLPAPISPASSTPLVVGFVVAGTGSFYFALAYIGVLGLIGAAAYISIVGDVRRVEID